MDGAPGMQAPWGSMAIVAFVSALICGGAAALHTGGWAFPDAYSTFPINSEPLAPRA